MAPLQIARGPKGFYLYQIDRVSKLFFPFLSSLSITPTLVRSITLAFARSISNCAFCCLLKLQMFFESPDFRANFQSIISIRNDEEVYSQNAISFERNRQTVER